MLVTKVTRSDVSSAINKITVASGAHSASRARVHLSASYTWCMVNGHCESNPVLNSVIPKTPASRDRVLSDSELAAIWNVCNMNTDFGRIVRLLILSGCRRQEIGSLRWSEIHNDAIHLPPERTKNGRAHVLPLTPLMRTIIESVPQMVDCDFCSAHAGRASRL